MTQARTTYQPGDEILAEIADLLIAQNQVLGDIRDRLPEPTAAGQPDPESEPVEVSEPAPKLAAGTQPEPEVVPVAEPALPRRPAKKAQPKRR